MGHIWSPIMIILMIMMRYNFSAVYFVYILHCYFLAFFCLFLSFSSFSFIVFAVFDFLYYDSLNHDQKLNFNEYIFIITECIRKRIVEAG